MKKWSLFAFVGWLALSAAAQRSPNVVFILADDLGYGDLGCYGQQKIRTPHLDRLAAEGMRFTQFYAGTSVCAPSRAALMSGLHTGHTPVRGNFEVEPEGQYPMADSTFTLGELFRGAGYATGLFGKWGLGYPGSEGAPLNQGFDRFFGYNCQRQSHNFFPDHLWDGLQRIALANTPARQQQYAPELIQGQALDFIAQHRDRPFFLYLAYTLPHAGLQLPEGDADLQAYQQQFRETPRAIPAGWNRVGYQPQAYPRAAYAAMVSRLDRYVGAVVEQLRALGLEQNTLVIFSSDNGPHREGGNDPAFFASSGGLRGIKRDLYEGGIRVPMIAWWPGQIRKHSRSDSVGALWDFMPTFAALTHQTLPGPTDGVSLLPQLTGRGIGRQHAYLYWEFHEDGGRQAVRMGRWKGVRQQVRRNPEGPVELYDLSRDPGETTDVSAAHPEVMRTIVRLMKEAHQEHPSFPLLTTP